MTANQDIGPRDPPEATYILHEIGRLAKGAALGRAVYGLCPAGCGCIWRDNFDGTMSLGMNQRSCKVCEPKPFSELIPLYARPAPETKGICCDTFAVYGKHRGGCPGAAETTDARLAAHISRCKHGVIVETRHVCTTCAAETPDASLIPDPVKEGL
jgi:hypothetical protein